MKLLDTHDINHTELLINRLESLEKQINEIDFTVHAMHDSIKSLTYKIIDLRNQLINSDTNERCEQNMKALNQMMKELKSIVAMVRPQVKKSGWYGEEIETFEKNPRKPMLLENGKE